MAPAYAWTFVDERYITADARLFLLPRATKIELVILQAKNTSDTVAELEYSTQRIYASAPHAAQRPSPNSSSPERP